MSASFGSIPPQASPHDENHITVSLPVAETPKIESVLGPELDSASRSWLKNFVTAQQLFEAGQDQSALAVARSALYILQNKSDVWSRERAEQNLLLICKIADRLQDYKTARDYRENLVQLLDGPTLVKQLPELSKFVEAEMLSGNTTFARRWIAAGIQQVSGRAEFIQHHVALSLALAQAEKIDVCAAAEISALHQAITLIDTDPAATPGQVQEIRYLLIDAYLRKIAGMLAAGQIERIEIAKQRVAGYIEEARKKLFTDNLGDPTGGPRLDVLRARFFLLDQQTPAAEQAILRALKYPRLPERDKLQALFVVCQVSRNSASLIPAIETSLTKLVAELGSKNPEGAWLRLQAANFAVNQMEQNPSNQAWRSYARHAVESVYAHNLIAINIEARLLETKFLMTAEDLCRGVLVLRGVLSQKQQIDNISAYQLERLCYAYIDLFDRSEIQLTLEEILRLQQISKQLNESAEESPEPVFGVASLLADKLSRWPDQAELILLRAAEAITQRPELEAMLRIQRLQFVSPAERSNLLKGVLDSTYAVAEGSFFRGTYEEWCSFVASEMLNRGIYQFVSELLALGATGAIPARHQAIFLFNETVKLDSTLCNELRVAAARVLRGIPGDAERGAGRRLLAVEIYEQIGELELALKQLRQLLQQSLQKSDLAQEAYIRERMARIYMSQGNVQEASKTVILGINNIRRVRLKSSDEPSAVGLGRLKNLHKIMAHEWQHGAPSQYLDFSVKPEQHTTAKVTDRAAFWRRRSSLLDLMCSISADGARRRELAKVHYGLDGAAQEEASKNYRQAAYLFLGASKRLVEILGDKNPYPLYYLYRAGRAAFEADQPTVLREAYKLAQFISTQMNTGRHHPIVGELAFLKGNLELTKKNFFKAKRLFSYALSILEPIKDAKHPVLVGLRKGVRLAENFIN